MPNVRVPLANSIESRSADMSKDSVIQNGFVEVESPEEVYIVKRPGQVSKIVRTGLPKGIFVYGLNVYLWDANNTNTTPTITLLSSL
jgi:hypothetical protein